LILDVRENGLVVFPRRELEELDGVTDFFGQRLGERDLVSQRGPVPQDRLGLGLVLPKVRFARQLIELADLPFE
jgi:hypothetical protein